MMCTMCACSSPVWGARARLLPRSWLSSSSCCITLPHSPPCVCASACDHSRAHALPCSHHHMHCMLCRGNNPRCCHCNNHSVVEYDQCRLKWCPTIARHWVLLPPAMMLSYMLCEVFLADKISSRSESQKRQTAGNLWLRIPGEISEGRASVR